MKDSPKLPPLRPAALRTRIAVRAGRPAPRRPLRLTLAVVSFNQWAVSERFLRSLAHPLAPAGGGSELLWVDNGSTDGSAERLARLNWRGLGSFEHARLLVLKRNYFISGAVNVALAEARGRNFIQADNDVLFAPGALEGFLAALEARPGALLSPLWQLTQGLLPRDFEPACYEDLPRAFARLERCNRLLRPEDGVAAGSCWGCETAAMLRLGGWDEGYRLACMDDDAILRWRAAGGSAGLLPLPVFHAGLKTRRADGRAAAWELEDAARFRALWSAGLDGLRGPTPWPNRLLRSRLGRLTRALRVF